MKAARINKYGGSEVIEINENAPRPQLKEGQVLVEVIASSINPIDYAIRAGYLKDAIKSLPITLGTDFAGKVVKISHGVTDLKIGDEVYGNAIVLGGGSGTLAEFAAANIENIALKPKTLDFLQAASLPLAGSSALQAIEEHINLQNGQKILIQGGGGGIGSLAIQLSKMHGAYVAATASPQTLDFVKSLGADLVIDYEVQDFTKIIKDYGAVFDTVGGETTNKSLTVLRKGLPAGRQGGIAVSMTGQFDPDLAKELGITAITQVTHTNAEKLKRIAELVDKGTIKPQVDKVFPLDQVREAFDYLEKGHPKGKVVVKMR